MVNSHTRCWRGTSPHVPWMAGNTDLRPKYRSTNRRSTFIWTWLIPPLLLKFKIRMKCVWFLYNLFVKGGAWPFHLVWGRYWLCSPFLFPSLVHGVHYTVLFESCLLYWCFWKQTIIITKNIRLNRIRWKKTLKETRIILTQLVLFEHHCQGTEWTKKKTARKTAVDVRMKILKWSLGRDNVNNTNTCKRSCFPI